MRVTSSATYRSFLTRLDVLNQQMDIANQQMSSGKKLVNLGSSPSGSADLVGLRADLAQLDQFKSNAADGSFFLTLTDSALSSVYNLVTSIYTKGSAVSSDTNNASERATTATEVRGLRDQILALANSEARGRYIFAGSEVLSQAFTIAGDTVTYQGDQSINSIEVDTGVMVKQNVPGSTVFAPVFAAVGALLTALDNNDQVAMKAALGQFSGNLADLSEVRARVGSDLGRLQDLQVQQDSEKTGLSARKNVIESVNMAEVATQLTQIKTALNATLTAESMVGQNNLFDFLA